MTHIRLYACLLSKFYQKWFPLKVLKDYSFSLSSDSYHQLLSFILFIILLHPVAISFFLS